MYFCLFYFIDEKIVLAPYNILIYIILIFLFLLPSVKYVYQHNTVQVCTAQSDVFYSQFDTEVAQNLPHAIIVHHFIYSVHF